MLYFKKRDDFLFRFLWLQTATCSPDLGLCGLGIQWIQSTHEFLFRVFSIFDFIPSCHKSFDQTLSLEVIHFKKINIQIQNQKISFQSDCLAQTGQKSSVKYRYQIIFCTSKFFNYSQWLPYNSENSSSASLLIIHH